AGGTSIGPVSSDTTIPAAPSTPAAPAPAGGATGVSITPTLSWTANGATGYDVQFGATNPPPSVSANQTPATYSPGSLTNGTTYFWRIVARNAGGTTTGPVWSFTTIVAAPSAPATPAPADGATGTSTTRTLSWTAGGPKTSRVRFGTTTPH